MDCCTLILQAFLPLMLVATSQGLLLTANEGDRVYLPCFSSANEEVFAWNISGSLYPANELPFWAEKVGDGIIVCNTPKNATGMYTCFAYDENNTTLHLLSSLYFTVFEDDNNSFIEDNSWRHRNSTELHLQLTEKNKVFIPCLGVRDTNEIQVWKIENAYHPVTNLPLYHQLKSKGILVHNSSVITPGTQYECFSIQNITLKVLYKVVVYFTQQRHSDQQIVFDLMMISRYTSFGRSQDEFGFKININNPGSTNYDCVDENATYFFQIVNINEEIVFEKSNKQNGRVTIPTYLFRNSTNFLEVFATNNEGVVCARWSKKLLADVNVLTDQRCVEEYDESCVMVPVNKYPDGIKARWSKFPNSNEDCACVIVKPFSSCSCFVNSPVTTILVKFEENMLCFKNLTRNENNTRLILYQDKQTPIVTGNIEVTRTIIKAVQFFIRGPDPNNPTISNCFDNKVCIYSENPQPWSPVVATDVTVYDVSNDVVYEANVSSNTVSIGLKQFPETCAPFTVQARAYTDCTRSSLSTFQTSGKKDVCSCLIAKVNLTLAVIKTGSDYFITALNVTCFSPDYNITNLFINAKCKNCEQIISKSFAISCKQMTTMLMVGNLTQLTTYNLSIEWISPTSNKSKCRLVDEESFNTSYEPWVIAVPIAAAVLLIIGLCVGVIAVCCCYKKRKCCFNGNAE